MVVKPEETEKLDSGEFKFLCIMYTGMVFGFYLANQTGHITKDRIAGVMGGLNTLELASGTLVHQHEDYNDFMGELLRRWKLAA